MHYEALRIERLRRQRSLVAKVQLAVNIVLDQRQLVTRQQLDQRPFLVVRHQTAQRVLEVSHEPTGFGLAPPYGPLQCFELNAFTRMGRHLDGLETDALQCLQRRVERRRLNQHRVPGTRYSHETQVQGLECTVGDDDFVSVYVQSIGQVTLCDLPTQAPIAWGQVVHRAPRVELLHACRHEPSQPLHWEEQRAGKGRSQWHYVANHC